jgi:hypothetical protein
VGVARRICPVCDEEKGPLYAGLFALKQCAVRMERLMELSDPDARSVGWAARYALSASADGQDRLEADERADALRLDVELCALRPGEPSGRADVELDPLAALHAFPQSAGDAVD